MEVNCNLLVEEAIVQQEEIVFYIEQRRVDEALGVQEVFESIELSVLLQFIFLDQSIVIFFSIPELIDVVSDVLRGEVVLDKILTRFEGLVVDQGQDFLVLNCGLDHALPDLRVIVFSKHHIVHCVM